MPIDDDARDRLASDLYEALRTGEPIDPPSDQHDLTVADAYDVQSAFVDRRLDDGATVVGHKIGLTSEAIREQLGIDEPDYGRLLDEMFVEGRTVPTGRLIEPRVEAEVGFVLAEPLEPPVTYLDVLAATRGVLPVAEIIDSRVRDWDIGLVDTVADNASAGLYVAGERLADPSGVDLSMEAVKLYRNGELAETGLGANVLDHPARAVAWLANALVEMDQRLEAGHVVLSGGMTAAVDVEPGDVVTAEFGTVGSLTMAFE